MICNAQNFTNLPVCDFQFSAECPQLLDPYFVRISPAPVVRARAKPYSLRHLLGVVAEYFGLIGDQRPKLCIELFRLGLSKSWHFTDSFHIFLVREDPLFLLVSQ